MLNVNPVTVLTGVEVAGVGVIVNELPDVDADVLAPYDGDV